MTFNKTQQTVIDLFIAAYGRTPTQNALDFFESKLNSEEMSSVSIANFMMDTQNNPEAAIRYPTNIPTSDKVETVFHNILGRGTATQKGLDFWSAKIDNSNDYSISDLMREILLAAKNQKDDAEILDNKSSVVEYFLEKTPIDQQINTLVYLDKVTTTSSVELAKKEIDINSNSNIDNKHQEEDKSNINNTYGELSNHDTEGVAVLDSGIHWDKNLKEISFSFNQDIPPQYNNEIELTDNWQSLNSSQKDATRKIMEELNKIIEVQLVEVPNEEGMIRLNIVNIEEEGVSGFASYPGANMGGDIFLSDEFNNRNSEYDLDLNQGKNGFSTIAHELGHALGLQHPFDSPLIDTITDNTNHSIMSYTSINDESANFIIDGSRITFESKNISPNLYSLYDVSTLQAIYGANTDTATEDNIYKMNYTDYEIKTIWDAGGKDKIDLSTTKGNSIIDLHGGTINSADQYSTNQIITMHQQSVNKPSVNDWIKAQILELEESNHLYTGEGNLTIAQGVIIEDISTGSGDDIITDNEVNNVISTGKGDDKIYIGSGGKDYLDGGAGNDFLYLDILSDEINIEKNENDNYLLVADNFLVEFTNIEQLHFSDNSTFTPDMLIG